MNINSFHIVREGSSAGEVDGSREHLWLCLHHPEWCLVLRHPPMGDLLIRSEHVYTYAPYIHTMYWHLSDMPAVAKLHPFLTQAEVKNKQTKSCSWMQQNDSWPSTLIPRMSNTDILGW